MIPASKALFSRPGKDMLEALGKALAATAGAFPVPGSHRAELPHAVRDLSRILTEERGQLSRPYWASPALFAAYLYFFLPWNLYRLSWLLPGLNLPLRPGARLLDLGSGPLTMPLALWCARPDLRDLPLHFVCADVAAQPMESGRAILELLAGQDSPWRVNLLRGPLEKTLRAVKDDAFDCVMAANVLNEVAAERGRPGSPDLGQRLAKLMDGIRACLAPDGRVLLVEPGTRLGGKVIALARESALSLGFMPLAPCPHTGPCPMQRESGDEKGASRQPFSGWCHFVHPVQEAPEALEELSRKARLQKRSMALSCLFLHGPGRATQDQDAPDGPGFMDELTELEELYAEIMEEESGLQNGEKRKAGVRPVAAGSPVPTRVISSPIHLPGREDARYACCEQGLALLLDAGRVPSGALVLAESKSGRRDLKSGALLLERTRPEKREGKRPEKQTRADKKPKPETRPRGGKRNGPQRGGKP